MIDKLSEIVAEMNFLYKDWGLVLVNCVSILVSFCFLIFSIERKPVKVNCHLN